MNHHDAEVSDVVIVLEDLDDAQTAAIVKQLEAAGLCVCNVNNDISTVEGSIPADKVSTLHRVERVRYVRSVLTYTVDYPCNDPRDKDGVEEICDESED